MATETMDTPIWWPSADRIDQSLLASFMRFLEQRNHGPFDGYDELWMWSVTDKAAFWDALRVFAGIEADWGQRILINENEPLRARFFPDTRINFAENLLGAAGAGPAIIFHSEDGRRWEWSRGELIDAVSRLHQALQAAGIGAGDRVAGLVPNTPQALIAALATASLGAVWSSCSPDFGARAAGERFTQIAPKALFGADAYRYGGRVFDLAPKLVRLAEGMGLAGPRIVFPLVDRFFDPGRYGDGAVRLDDFVNGLDPARIAFERVKFDAPLYILYSSGTTGPPKCVTHSVGGTLIQHVKEHRLQIDIRPGDRLFYHTSCGWMMWNWMVSALGSGATLVLYDGSPFYPGPDRFADIVQAEKVTHFGASAKYFDACEKAGLHPAATHNLSTLRTVLSTGSPLAPERFDYIYTHWKSDLCLSSIAGGTDIVGCFVGGNPIGPVWRGQCQKRHLGMDVCVFDEKGREVAGQPGELVCRGVHPSMPVGFWNDSQGKRYRAAYFGKYGDTWCHGDHVELTPQGGMRFFGRSDSVLNPGGVRIGTAEIYRLVEQIDEVAEAVAVGQEFDGDTRIVLFVRLADAKILDADIANRIRSEIRSGATPRHVPAVILAVDDIPRTRSGKIAELAVREAIHGREIANTGSLANPECLDGYRDLPELRCSTDREQSA